MPDDLGHTQTAAPTLVEAIRLVIWDLDETFWRGTLTEGGISEYVTAHHDIIVTLAHRGIMSSVCSKNDAAKVLPILAEKGILPYLIFPSISWEPKGMRLAATIEAVGLRPASVLFIDDNPNNLAEAAAVVPGIQTARETEILSLLDDPRCAGKDDSALTRLKQYKLLEDKKRDEVAAGGDNAAFLRSCDIRVHIEYNIEPHIDRAIELINRTNQLNYTKQRLPEKIEQARRIMLANIRRRGLRMALVQVIDNYGDYGFVGFVMARVGRADHKPGLARATLIHYCFSCRTLGMLVEHWVYDYMRRPALTVVGEVLTDLDEPRDIDWIRLTSAADGTAADNAPGIAEMRVYGGCEARTIGHFLAMKAKKVKIRGNFPVGGLFVRLNSAALLASVCRASGPDFADNMAALGIPLDQMGRDYFDDAPDGTVFVFSGALDAGGKDGAFSRHREHGWQIRLGINGNTSDFAAMDDAALDQALVASKFKAAETQHLRQVKTVLDTAYERCTAPQGEDLATIMHDLLDRVPPGCKFIALLDDDRARLPGGRVISYQPKVVYNTAMKALLAPVPFAQAVDIGEYVGSEEEITAGNHYARSTFAAVAEAVAEIAAGLQPKSAPLIAAA